MKYFLIVCFLFKNFLPCPFDQTPTASPKTTEERGHQRTPSDATVSAVAEVPASDASQQPQGANGDVAHNQ